MGILKKITDRVLGTKTDSNNDQQDKQALLRRCYFEVMEQRRVLSADSVIAGVTYLEGDAGQDTTPDHFEVTFEGGSDTTQLTQFVINGDQDGSGSLTDGDMFFDVASSDPGTGGFHGFQFDAANSVGLTESDITNFSVSADGLVLTVDIANFQAGDKLAFTIDVDEVERFRTDKIASGVEFEASLFSATFSDEHFDFVAKDVSVNTTLEGGQVQPQSEGIFYDEYNQLFAAGEQLANNQFDLELDNETGQADRTAGAIDAFDLVAKPITISGNVYHDEDTDCNRDASESGIAGVNVTLQLLNESTGIYESVASTQTDADGRYEFGLDLNLMPGTYRLVETQPDGFLNVGAEAGTVAGDPSGVVQNDADGAPNIIANIEVPLGGTAATEYNFCEVRPASLSGNVYHDVDDDGVRDPGEEGIANVLIQVTRVGAKDGVASDPFANTDPIFVRTDANGFYEVDLLPPGVYEIIEINNYPANEVDPLAGFIDGKDTVGQVGGVTVGTGSNDRINQVILCADDEGVEYNFGELKPAQISGYVSVTTPEGNCIDPTDPNHSGIAGVQIELLDADGNLVATTQTDSEGRYEFGDLDPGTYSIVQVQPNGYLDVDQSVGSVDGSAIGTESLNRFDQIVLGSDSTGTMYNFCETLPAEISGTVWHDENNDGALDSGEERINNVVIQLFDANGDLVAQTTTDGNGDYRFENLFPGEYSVREVQPDTYVDGQDSLGTILTFHPGSSDVGTAANDAFSSITLRSGDLGVNYDFGEIRLGSISGMVHADSNGNCVFESGAGDQPLDNVTLELLDTDGNVVATTTTNENGEYTFDGLLPGEYSVRQVQPDDYFTLGQSVGDGGGEASTNLLSGIVVQSGQQWVDYNFCEEAPAEIHGLVWEDGPAIETTDGVLPSNYRDLRDGVFTAGVDTPLSGIRMQLYYYIDPASDSINPVAVTLSDVMPEFYTHLGTNDPDAPIWVETDASGSYSFLGLRAGNYIVLESQPDGLFDSNDTAGTTTGLTYNNLGQVATASGAVLNTFSSTQVMDAIVNIRVNAGGISEQNNFSEVDLTTVAQPPEPPVLPPPVPPTPPQLPPNPTPPRPGITGFPGLAGSEQGLEVQPIGRGASFQTQATVGTPYTWHLSIINADQPRNEEDAVSSNSPWQQVSSISNLDWNRFEMDDAVWTFYENRGQENYQFVSSDKEYRFGTIDGTPLAGDFDGDGLDEVAVFKDGFWMIDLNGNGIWDADDLLAKLGSAEDRPVIGDWDGDGKEDIGIFGPMWENDREAITREVGLPNPDNMAFTKPKNIPSINHEEISGIREMKLTQQQPGRSDVIDHVFGIEDGVVTPIAGDWNGNGIRSIGTFDSGIWHLDMNGDGEFDHHDVTAHFGESGDIPVVGDFDGNGIEEIAVYRAGTWIIDSNGNRQLDATDKTFRMGTANDQPVPGDWDGDGRDEPGLYTEKTRPRF